jgi:putative glutamine amidotransferase
MTARPLIGVSTYLESGARWGAWALEAVLLPAAYPRLVQRAGGVALLLPPDAPERAAAALARLDARTSTWPGTAPSAPRTPGRPRPSGTPGNSR